MSLPEHMARMVAVLAVVAALGACSQPTGDGGDSDDGSGGGTTYPPTSQMLSAVFDEADAETTTYRDVAPPEMPDLLSQNDDPALGELKSTFESMQDFLASEAGDCTIRAPAVESASCSATTPGVIRTADTPTPYCYLAGSFSICLYRWQEGTTHITVEDTRGTVTNQWRVYYKGLAGGIFFPGDTEDPDDFGYLLQDHTYTTDQRSGHTQWMFEPGLCWECYQRPWSEHTFEVSEPITVKTPWSDETAARRTYTHTMYYCWPDCPDPLYRYHMFMSALLQREPNQDLIIEHRFWSATYKQPYLAAEWLYDHSENTISWIFYNEDGTVKDTGQVPQSAS